MLFNIIKKIALKGKCNSIIDEEDYYEKCFGPLYFTYYFEHNYTAASIWLFNNQIIRIVK